MKIKCRPVILPLLSLCLLFFSSISAIVRAENDMSVEHARQQAKQAGVDETVLDRLLATAQRRRINASTQIRWLKLMKTAAEEELPIEPLNNKIEEGLVKNISGERIAAAIKKTLQDLRYADLLIKQDLHAAKSFGKSEDYGQNITRLGKLLSAGLDKTEIEGLFCKWRPTPLRQRVEALSFYAVVKQAGLQPATANQIAATGLQHGHFHGFPLELAMMIKAARIQQISERRIMQAALKVVRGQQSVLESYRRLEIQQMHANPLTIPRRLENVHSRGPEGNNSNANDSDGSNGNNSSSGGNNGGDNGGGDDNDGDNGGGGNNGGDNGSSGNNGGDNGSSGNNGGDNGGGGNNGGDNGGSGNNGGDNGGGGNNGGGSGGGRR
jgi:antitoxin component of RelBE/YafQ-DinJ toxin-antitoxin module